MVFSEILEKFCHFWAIFAENPQIFAGFGLVFVGGWSLLVSVWVAVLG